MNSIFKKQAELQAGFMHEEVTELMNEIGGGRDAVKPWSDKYEDSRAQQYIPTEHVKSEAIDMLCFAINVCLAAGVTPDLVEEEYEKVFQKNKGRQNAYRSQKNISI